MTTNEKIKKFWKFLNEDSWESLIVFAILVFLFLYFIFMPTMSFVLGTKYSLVIVESCSMYHRQPLENILEDPIYDYYGINSEDSENWKFQKGFTKGDIIFSIRPKNVKVGDVIIFDSGKSDVRYPIIHRVLRAEESFTTKGDNNEGLLVYEKEIPRENVLAKSLFRIPYVGWIKLALVDWRKSPENRGFCK
jgi:signal peptidase I